MGYLLLGHGHASAGLPPYSDLGTVLFLHGIFAPRKMAVSQRVWELPGLIFSSAGAAQEK